MTLETPQGRADHLARSIEVFGRIVPVEETLEQLRAVDARAARGAGAALHSGSIAIATIGGGKCRGARCGVNALQTIVAEPWADWGLIDCGHGLKYERYGKVRVVRPEPQAMWAPASDELGSRRDLHAGVGRGGRRALGPAPAGAGGLAAGARWRQIHRLADAVPPPRLLPRHGAAMGLDAEQGPMARRCSTCSATPASAACC